MPRAPRVVVDGGIYHVYNRVTRGEPVFDQDEEALELVGILWEVRDRDRLVVLAWCVMPNHYHLAVRCTTAPLSRSMASIQSRVSKSFNRRNRQLGPFWQGRYRAKLVEDPAYLQQLVLYIHLNPTIYALCQLYGSGGDCDSTSRDPVVNNANHRFVSRAVASPRTSSGAFVDFGFGKRKCEYVGASDY